MSTSTQAAGNRDSEHQLVVTARDGSQSVASSAVLYGHASYAPLSWWRACGFTAEDKDLWSKIADHPEHARLLLDAGFAPADLRGLHLGSVRLREALQWLNPYREATGRMPKTWGEFQRLLAALRRCGDGIKGVTPMAAANYALAMGDTTLDAAAYVFAASDPCWVSAICQHGQPDVRGVAMVRLLMQVGAGPEVLGVLAIARQNLYWFEAVETAAKEIFCAGEFTADEQCYHAVRDLAEMVSAAPRTSETIVRLFLTGGDRGRLHAAVMADGIHDAVRLEGLFEADIATALVGGFL